MFQLTFSSGSKKEKLVENQPLFIMSDKTIQLRKQDTSQIKTIE